MLVYIDVKQYNNLEFQYVVKISINITPNVNWYVAASSN